MLIFLRPILWSVLFVVLFNTIFFLPIPGFSILIYVLGGSLSVFLFKASREDSFKDVTWLEALYLGLGTGLLVGLIVAFIYILSLQNHDVRESMINSINKITKMHSYGEAMLISNLSFEFYLAFTIASVLICSVFSTFGTFCIFPFINRAKK